MDRNPGIDILRAGAVSLVILYHGLADNRFVGVIGGAGWMGVDLFFVLSGFLVGSGYLRLKETGGSLTQFFLKRAGRLVPAYLAALVLAGLLLGPIGGALWHRFLEELPGYLFFQANWKAPLVGPLWSISAEAQFYLLIPVLGAVALRTRKHPWWGLAAVFGIPLAVRAGLAIAHPEIVATQLQDLAKTSLNESFGAVVYLNTFAHCEGMLLGLWLALHWDVRRSALGGRSFMLPTFTPILAVAAFIGLYAALAPWRTWMPRPLPLVLIGFSLNAACCGFMLVSFASMRRGLPSVVFSVVRWLSDRIYSLYLAQALLSLGLVLSVPTARLMPGPALVVMAVYVGMTLVLGSMLYRFVEVPGIALFAWRNRSVKVAAVPSQLLERNL